MARLFAGGNPAATTGSATAETSVQGVPVRYVVTRPRVGCTVWRTELGQADQITDLVDAAGVGLASGVVVSDGYGQIPRFGLPDGLVVNGVWLNPDDTSDTRFWLPVNVGAADVEAVAPRPPTGTPAGYVRTIQSDGTIVWAAPPGLGTSAVTAVDY